MPYGQDRWTAGSTPTDFGFTSQRAERGFGLYDYNARYYSPVLGRFVSPDSIIPNPNNPQDFNRYGYTRNNPLRYTDPSGHSGWLNNFLLGATSEFINNNYDALFVPADSPMRPHANDLVVNPDSNVSFQLGRAAGSLVNVAQGLAEIEGSIAIAGGGGLGGLATAPTVAGAAAGGAAVAAGAGMAIHGGIVAGQGAVGLGNATGNIVNAIFGFGKGRPPNQVHHLLTNKSRKWTPVFKELTEKYDLDLDGSWNKVEIPHQGRHANEYHDWVRSQVQQIDRIAQGDRGKFLELFDERVRQPVLENPKMTRKEWWK